MNGEIRQEMRRNGDYPPASISLRWPDHAPAIHQFLQLLGNLDRALLQIDPLAGQAGQLAEAKSAVGGEEDEDPMPLANRSGHRFHLANGGGRPLRGPLDRRSFDHAGVASEHAVDNGGSQHGP
ncbi:MAG TPA: hypothetical protein VK386_01010 [Acidimicrobiales bacterium]|nr:hypothetical protein [Acidimicrobiales bacterium]